MDLSNYILEQLEEMIENEEKKKIHKIIIEVVEKLIKWAIHK